MVTTGMLGTRRFWASNKLFEQAADFAEDADSGAKGIEHSGVVDLLCCR
jgi:hypothetical protein